MWRCRPELDGGGCAKDEAEISIGSVAQGTRFLPPPVFLYDTPDQKSYHAVTLYDIDAPHEEG